MDYGISVIQNAYSNRIIKLEQELEKCKKEINEKNDKIYSLTKINENLKNENDALRDLNKKLVDEKIQILKSRQDSQFSALPSKSETFSYQSKIEPNNKRNSPTLTIVKERKSLMNTSSYTTRSNNEESKNGKSFFIVVKNKLPPQRFLSFIQTLKLYKTKEITKSQTIEIMKKIFGVENKELFDTFQKMILSNY